MCSAAGAQPYSDENQRLQEEGDGREAICSGLPGRPDDACGCRMSSTTSRGRVDLLKVSCGKEGKSTGANLTELRGECRASAAGWQRAGKPRPGGPGVSSSGDTDKHAPGQPGNSSVLLPYQSAGSTGTSASAEHIRQQGRGPHRRTQGDIRRQKFDVRLGASWLGHSAVEDRSNDPPSWTCTRGNGSHSCGSVMRGVVRSVDKATRTDRKGSLTVAFDQVTVRGRDYPIRGTVTQALESEGIKGEAAKIGAGSAVGAIIGGIVGGLKGAVLGVLIGVAERSRTEGRT